MVPRSKIHQEGVNGWVSKIVSVFLSELVIEILSEFGNGLKLEVDPPGNELVLHTHLLIRRLIVRYLLPVRA